jgi:alpha-glucosidase
LRTVPVTWDETLVLPGSSIGALAAFARRKGNDWYVAVINGTDSSVAFQLPPSFLPKGKRVQATVITDAPGDKGFVSNTIEWKALNKFWLQPAGGLVIQIKTNNK